MLVEIRFLEGAYILGRLLSEVAFCLRRDRPITGGAYKRQLAVALKGTKITKSIKRDVISFYVYKFKILN